MKDGGGKGKAICQEVKDFESKMWFPKLHSRTNEMMLAWNGEDIYHCDSIVKEALESYLSDCKREGDKEGHFIRRSSLM